MRPSRPLRGLLRCSACDAAMIHSWTKRGPKACLPKIEDGPTPSVRSTVLSLQSRQHQAPQQTHCSRPSLQRGNGRGSRCADPGEGREDDAADDYFCPCRNSHSDCRSETRNRAMTIGTTSITVDFSQTGRPRQPPYVSPKTSRVARLIALAYTIGAKIRAGEIAALADAARRLGLTRARMTQIANLTRRAPVERGRDPVSERSPRTPARFAGP